MMLLMNIAGVALIALIIWWFWLYRPAEVKLGAGELLICVENGTYSPDRIQVPAGKPATLHFLRKDQSPCAETLLIPDLQISETLPLGKNYSLSLPALSPGEYPFHCQMQMYRGKLIVSEAGA